MKYGVIFFLFWLLHIQCKALDEIQHLFGQFQTVYRNMAIRKIYVRLGSALPSIDFTNPPYFYKPSGTDQISNITETYKMIVYQKHIKISVGVGYALPLWKLLQV